ncbi:MAG: hypothetical protein AAFX02_11220 [Pseudomonadota bacterium]
MKNVGNLILHGLAGMALSTLCGFLIFAFCMFLFGVNEAPEHTIPIVVSACVASGFGSLFGLIGYKLGPDIFNGVN